MLDLTKLTAPKYEIKMTDGNVLTLNKPSQALLNKMIKAKDVTEDDPEVINILYAQLVDILNLNTQGLIYTIEDVSTIDIQVVALIFQDYFKFISQELGES